jgi:hypothetical protein
MTILVSLPELTRLAFELSYPQVITHDGKVIRLDGGQAAALRSA